MIHPCDGRTDGRAIASSALSIYAKCCRALKTQGIFLSRFMPRRCELWRWLGDSMCDSVDNRLCSQYGTFRIRRSSHADIIQTSHGRRSLGWGIGPGQRIVAEGAYIGVGNGRGIPSSAERVWGVSSLQRAPGPRPQIHFCTLCRPQKAAGYVLRKLADYFK